MFRSSRSLVIGLGFVGWAWVIGGMVMLLLSGFREVAGWGSRGWPHVTGRVIESHFMPVKKASGAAAFYKIHVAYTYSPSSRAGAVFCSDRLSYHGFIDPADDSYSLEQARRITGRYPVGSPVDVYYRASDPRWGVLRPGTDLGTFSGSLIGSMPVVFGILLLILVRRIRRKSKPTVPLPEPS